MMRRAAAVAAIVLSAGAAVAQPCANPDALGTARTLVVDPTEHGRIGSMQYTETLPLADKEVVLTFDDGPLPPYTPRVLETLARECVKATFFIVGRQARAFPDLVRRVYNEGHTVGTHSQNHPLNFVRLTADRARQEVEDGIASTAAALGDTAALAPFFRFPGLGRSTEDEAMVAARGLMVWSADFPADDWLRISAQQVMARALERLERKGKGVLLLHDIQPATALALPALLRELKARGYRIVHVETSQTGRPRTVTEPEQWASSKARRAWPRTVETMTVPLEPELAVPSPDSFGWPNPFRPGRLVSARSHTAWPSPLTQLIETIALGEDAPALPVPSPQAFGIPHPFGPRINLHLPAPSHQPNRYSELPPLPETPRPGLTVRHLSGPTLLSTSRAAYP